MQTETENPPTTSAQLEVIPPDPPKKIKESKENPAELADKYLRIGKDGHSLTVEGDITLEEFLPLVDFKCNERRGAGFQIGDLLLYGMEKWKDRLELVMEQTGRKMNTLLQYISVAKAIPSNLRSEKLEWSHHLEIARLANCEEAGGRKKAKEIIQKIEKGNKGEDFTRKEIRELVEKEMPAPAPKPAKEGKAIKRRGPKTKASKNAGKSTARDPLAEEQAAIQNLRKKLFPQLVSVLDTIRKELDSKPSKEAKLELRSVIYKASKVDKDAIYAAAPEPHHLSELAYFLKGIS